tara:strand:+ start:119 stop:370 length:252 start_codon:yes stop_codon:yes gene_type:complete
MLIKEAKDALELINSGKWLQLEGSVGRYCNDLLESKVIIKDEAATTDHGPVTFKDGYGRFVKQYRFKINESYDFDEDPEEGGN